jgi:hypothetical protein
MRSLLRLRGPQGAYRLPVGGRVFLNRHIRAALIVPLLSVLLGGNGTTGTVRAARTVALQIMADGSVLVEGNRYADEKSLHLKIAEIDRRRPRAEIEVQVTRHVPNNKLFVGIDLIARATGRPKIGFLMMAPAN